MNKTDLINAVAKEAGITKPAAEKAINGIMAVMTDTLAGGDNVTLVGFGSFSVTKRAAREGRNPQTGKAIKIPAKKVVKFKPGKGLADSVK